MLIGVLVLGVAIVAYNIGSRGAVAPTVEDLGTTTEKITEQPVAQPDVLKTETVNRPSVSSPGTNIPTQPSVGVSRAKEFVRPSGYLNIEKLTYRPNMNELLMSDLIGKKVILLDFWSMSCISCERAHPYLNMWYEKYRNLGLEVVGIHAPRFAFEKEKNNIAKTLSRMGVIYPNIMDNNFETWKAYGNKAWPYIYLVDIKGNIVYSKVGEGSMTDVEKKIQSLLNERAAYLKQNISATLPITSPSNAVVLGKVRTPEIYFGTTRNGTFLANAIAGKGGTQDITPPLDTSLKDKIYFSGSWNFTPEYAESRTLKSSITLGYGAGEVYIVAGSGEMSRVKVLLDGQPLGARAGKDVKTEGEESVMYIQDNRIYHVVSDKGGYGEHKLEIITDVGVQLYTVTFG